MLLGQFSTANVFTIVMGGCHDIPYCRLDGKTMQNAIVAGQNDKLYYIMWSNDARGARCYIATLNQGTYTMAQLAAELQRAPRLGPLGNRHR